MQNHYIIGDIHGEYQKLLDLIAKLPKDAKLIFVGDLIDRGFQSREVIEYIRANNHQVVRGNHEQSMVEYGDKVIEILLRDKVFSEANMWIFGGLVETLFSYGFVDNRDDEYFIVKDAHKIEVFKNDMEWMSNLPLYIKIENPHNVELPIVVSHASIGDYWDLEQSDYEQFEFTIMSNRKRPSADAPIFNIYGHCNVSSVERGENYVILDTGCGRSDGAGKLSAYCVETREVFEV